MKQIFEKLIVLSNSLQGQKQSFMISLLEQLSDKISTIQTYNESYKCQLSGTYPKQYNDNLDKAISILKLFGFSEIGFATLNPMFLGWMIKETMLNEKYNAKLINYHILESFQESYFMCCAGKNGNEPTYKEVRDNILTWTEKIKEDEETLKLSLPELIKKIDGEN